MRTYDQGVVADASDQGVLLSEEAPELAHQRLHGIVGGANDEVHRHLDPVVSAVEMRFKLVGQVIGCYMDAKLMCFC